MNQGILAPGGWMAPLGRLLRQLHGATTAAPHHGQTAAINRHSAFPMRGATLPSRIAATARVPTTHSTRRAPRSPLRVIRVVETGQASALAGRILISGRMADVCAELDRMVAREAAMQART